MKLQFLELPDAERRLYIEQAATGMLVLSLWFHAAKPEFLGIPVASSHVSTDDCPGSDFRQSHSSSRY